MSGGAVLQKRKGTERSMQMKKGILSFTLCLALIFAGLGGTWTVSSAGSKPVKLNVRKGRRNLLVVRKYQLKVKKAKGIIIKKKTFTKKGAAVSVSKKGKVTAKRKGKATVICKVKYRKKGKKKIYRKTLKCKFNVSLGKIVLTPKPSGISTPVVSKTPDITALPEDTKEPGITAAPGNTEKPGTTAAPGNTEKPGTTSVPGTSAQPEQTEKPDVTPAPGNTEKPGVTSEPENTKKPGVTTAPENTEEPGQTALPGSTATVTPTVQKTEEPVNTPVPSQPSVNVDSPFALIKDMGAGINLGNTFEACGDWINSSSVSNYELAWQAEKNLITEDMIQGMRQAGFKTLRIPVAWSNMMSEDGTYTINSAYFNRIDQIINYALKAGMYPIVNIHYDGGWWARFGSKDATEREEAMKKYKAMWTQLADHYKEYSNMLIFESANEELGTRLNSTGDYSNSGYYASEDDLYALTNKINQTFVDIVRESGGKNADRYLLIAGYNTDIDKTCDSRFKMPGDTLDDHLLLSVHYYTPSPYCINDNPYDSGWEYRASWGSEADIQELKAYLAKLRMRYTSQGVPVIIGEYGVANTTIYEMENGVPKRDSYGNRITKGYEKKEGRELFYRTVCEYAMENGMCPVLWEGSGDVYQRSKATMLYQNEAALYQELAAKAESMEAFAPAEGDGSI